MWCVLAAAPPLDALDPNIDLDRDSFVVEAEPRHFLLQTHGLELGANLSKDLTGHLVDTILPDMGESSPVSSLGWTQKSLAATLLAAMEDHRKQVGARIRSLREAKGMSQEDLAHAAHVSHKTVSRWETGRNVGYATNIKALAKALGVEPKDITGEPPAPLGLGASSDLPATRADVQRIEAKLDLLIAKLFEPTDTDLQRAADELGLGEEFAQAMERARDRELHAQHAAHEQPGRAKRTRTAG